MKAGPGKHPGRASRLARWAQLAFPRSIRNRYGTEMEQAVTDRLEEPEILAEKTHRRELARMLTDTVAAGLRLRFQRIGLLPGPVSNAARRSPQKRDMRLQMIFQDLRYALKALRTSPSFTLVAILLLALGIGANSAIFSLVSAYLLKPYPYAAAERLVTVHTSSEKDGIGFGQFSLPDYVDLRAQSPGLADVALWRTRSYNVSNDAVAIRLPGAHVTANFFDVLGAPVLLGRTFAAGEDQPGTNLVVLSEGAWRNDSGADPELVGGEMLLDGTSHHVIGVLRAGGELPANRKLWKAQRDAVEDEPRQRRINRVIGRLSPDSTLGFVREQLAAFAGRLATAHPDTNGTFSFTAQSLRDYRAATTAPSLRLLMAAGLLVLLIVCANLANLLLVRAGRRHHEFAVRMALGANRARIVRQLLLEGLVVSLAGAGLGMLVGQFAVVALMGTRPVPLPALYNVTLDGRVLVFVLVTTVCSVILFGLLPAIRASRPDLQETLGATARTTAGIRGRMLSGLVVAEVALSTILLVGAVLAMRSFLNVLNIAPGFDAESSVTLSVQPPSAGYSNSEAADFVRSLERRVSALPGVVEVGAAAVLPLMGDAYTNFQADSQTELEAMENAAMLYYPVTPRFFAAMHIPLLAGRAFTDADDANSDAVVVISASTAARYWPGDDAIGQRLRQRGSEWMRIVGVVGDVRQIGLDREPEPQMYLPHAQDPWRGMALVIRSEGDPVDQIAAVRAEIRRLDPSIAPYNILEMTDAVGLSTFQRRFLALLVGIFGTLSAGLAGIGLYGVVAAAAAQRTREIGVRMALGAARRDVMRLIAGQGMRLTVIGLALGLLGALSLSRVMGNQLFEVNSTDPGVYAGVALALSVVALLASVIPGRRASRLNPVVALRSD